MLRSEQVFNQLRSIKQYKNARNILFYASTNKEVDTLEEMRALLETKKKEVIVPFVEKNNPMLQISQVVDFNDLTPKTFRILEPKADKVISYDKRQIEIALVPGVAFDRKGHRLGYGLGFYDRFLKTLPKKTVKIGLAYDFQLIERLPIEIHDIPVDIVVTESKVVKA